jgi:site-specific recombinase XerD
MALTPDDLAGLFSAEQLELLAEFADDLEPRLITSHGPSRSQPAAAKPRSKKATRSAKGTTPRAPLSPLEIIMAAQATVRAKQTEAANFAAHKNEWNAELASEVNEADKHDHRMPAVLTYAEIRDLLNAAKRNKRNYLIIRMFYATGVRRSELEAIKLADLYLAEQKILIRSGKGDKDRYVMLDPETARLLDNFVYGRALDDPIFDIGDQQMNRVVKRYAAKLGIIKRYEAMGRKFSAHALRHTFATHLWESGIDVFILRDLLGHRYLSTTRRYIAIGLGRIAKDYTAHHPLCQRDFWDEDKP